MTTMSNDETTYVFTDRAGEHLTTEAGWFALSGIKMIPIAELFESLTKTKGYEGALGYVLAKREVEGVHLVAVPWGLVLTIAAAKVEA